MFWSNLSPTVPLRVHSTTAGIFWCENSMSKLSPTSHGWVISAIRPPADMLRTRIICSPLAPTSLATRTIGRMRSSSRRSLGRGTAVLSEKVVESKAASSSSIDRAGLRRMSEPNI